MKKLFVPYSIALKAKNAGFDEECLAYYREDAPENLKENIYEYIEPLENNAVRDDKNIKPIFAPLYQQLIDWFREKHNLSIQLEWSPSYQFDGKPNGKGGWIKEWSDAIWEITIVKIGQKDFECEYHSPDFQRGGGKQFQYYSALDAAIEYAFEIIKTNSTIKSC